ncbi:alkyldihydroxyacetonephosphate synthase [Solimonas aquatica]|uniref:Alkyldihydroxyacetonephosphate synthase n=2 Tax=Solimonas aquatica TaxID=489703 RepID=A0A1H9I260_9GAMM|nr:alkyldihydroxyacetonephosphate synthase [Solimonas aquatica]
MRRWNGWGDEEDREELGAELLAFLREHIGPGRPREDLSLAQALAAVPPPRLPTSTRFSQDSELRLRHARGQSFADYLALRSGDPGPLAEAVALPGTHEETAEALAEAGRLGAIVIAYGGGTSVAGQLQVPRGERPVLNISLARMNRLLGIDERAQLARFGAGTPGPQIEAQLRGYRALLGHFPQSYRHSTLGGWVMTRASGQQSLRYGSIGQLFEGGRLITPGGELSFGGTPAAGSGPDLRELLLGSQGRLGLLTEVSVRIRGLPEHEDFHAVFFPDWENALEAARSIAQAELPLSMLRLSNELETETRMRRSGHAQSIKWLQRYLGMRGVGGGQCMMLFGASGSLAGVRRMRREALALAKRWQGVHVGKLIGQSWRKNRFRSPLLRNALWEQGYAADCVASTVNWPAATGLMRAVERAAREALAAMGERVHVCTHLSQVGRQGCSLCTSLVWPLQAEREADLALWQRLRLATAEATHAHGGSLSHQQAPAPGGDEFGLRLLRAAAAALDPGQMMNPGKLF